MKKLSRERMEDTPIKKRLVAEMHRNGRTTEGAPKTPKIKKEIVEDTGEAASNECGKHAPIPGAKPLDLSPGLKHTLAQFHISSQVSLGGPATFSARNTQECMSPGIFMPLASPPALPGPLLIPSDTSTELAHSLLEGESISCFMVGGENRLCLPQVLNSVLRDFSLQQINTVCDELYIYCSRCNADQLHILKVLGILPFNAPSCGLITLTDAQRLCNTLLRPGILMQNTSKHASKSTLTQLKETDSNFKVEHECLGKCQGLFVMQLYTQPNAPCIQCLECQLMFSPQKFVMHSHKSPDKRTCHWGFDSAKWHCYLQLGKKYYNTPEEKQLKQRLEEIKGKFSFQQKMTFEKKDHSEDFQVKKARYNLSNLQGKLPDNDSVKKPEPQQEVLFEHWHADIKQDPDQDSVVHPSYYLYMYDKVVAPNVSLRASLTHGRDSGRAAEGSEEVLGALLKHHYHEGQKRASSCSEGSLDEEEESRRVAKSVGAIDLHTRSCSADQVKSEHVSEHGPLAVAMETNPCENACLPFIKDISSEDDKDKIVVEIVQMYTKQQERLNATLEKKTQLEMELDLLRSPSRSPRLKELSEQCELQQELELVQSEQASRLEELREEQMELERRLEQLRQQGCACDRSSERDREAQYAAQLSELRQRLDQAEADRQELQEDLQREREAREKLEKMITEMKLQISEKNNQEAKVNSKNK
ncbi:ski-like protein [Acipenser oxyrinchus oxyrinchus]|uniref:Ski-like protein n=1 Tax=Acipenser oxyrinchus oxyrinchus TaxID=40147 RepID=A0AAD8G2I1_ACIOX|nr:ski-like protein [Acipenser oxyrinchus oxyrinchus]